MSGTSEAFEEAARNLYRVFCKYECVTLAPAEPVFAGDRVDLESIRQQLAGAELNALESKHLLDYYYLAVDHVGIRTICVISCRECSSS
jgi:hypothetical protein